MSYRPDTSRLGAWGVLPFFAEYLPALTETLSADPRQILPPAHQVFAALELTQPEATRVVILGQDPYPTPGHAHGLAFSAEADTRPLPRSLSNIYKEMQEDIGDCPTDADLRFLAHQGVLLLNTTLSVAAGEAGAHAKLGWDRLTAQILNHLGNSPRAYLLWGAHAQKVANPVSAQGNLKIETAHPSPLSARRGFFGSRPFSRVNNWLEYRGETPIDWAQTDKEFALT